MKDENKKVSQNRQKKEAIVDKMTAKVVKAKAMVFTNYQGLTHQQIESLKRTLKKIDGDYVIIKNTLMLHALKDKNLTDEQKKSFVQPTATLLAYDDVVEPFKALAKMVKDFKLPLIKFGILENRVITETEVSKLATLPALPVLRGQLVGMLNSPIQNLHRALSWNMTMFVMTLKAIESKKASS
jgi:large subunit ribosomal protein L10